MSTLCYICQQPINESNICFNGHEMHWDCYEKEYVLRPYFRERRHEAGNYIIRRMDKRKYTYYLQMTDTAYFAYSGYKVILVRDEKLSPFAAPKQLKGFANVDQALIYWGLNIKKDKRFIKLAKKWNDNIKAKKNETCRN